MPAGRMTLLPRSLLLLIMAVVSLMAVAQEPTDNQDPLYGFDPLLYNGRMYYFYPMPGTGGTQYLYNEFDTKGSVTLRSVTYPNLNINYDVYNQQLVLKFKDAIGSNKIIEVSYAWLESFIMQGKLFEVFPDAGSVKKIYQVLGSGDKKILYSFRKKLLLHNQTTSGIYYFSKIITEKYVYNESRIVKFNNNHTFISAFSQPEQTVIKKYLRKQNINVKKATDVELSDLINYCKTIGGS
jgi:hypothetical protein